MTAWRLNKTATIAWKRRMDFHVEMKKNWHLSMRSYGGKGEARKKSSILTCPFAHGDWQLAVASCQLPARSPTTEHARLSATSGCTSTQLLHHTMRRLQRQFGGGSGVAQFCPIFSPDSLCLASSPLNLIQVRLDITFSLLPWLHSQSSDPSPPPPSKESLAFKYHNSI